MTWPRCKDRNVTCSLLIWILQITDTAAPWLCCNLHALTFINSVFIIRRSCLSVCTFHLWCCSIDSSELWCKDLTLNFLGRVVWLLFLIYDSLTFKPGVISITWAHVAIAAFISSCSLCYHRSLWPSCLRRGSAVDRLLGLQARIPPRVWISVLWMLYVVRSRPEESCRLWRVILCDTEISRMRVSLSELGSCARQKKYFDHKRCCGNRVMVVQ